MATENFTGYTEVDTGADLTVTASKADANDVLGNVDCYLYKDFTANHFDALDIDYEIYIEDPVVDLGFGGPGLANAVGTPGGTADWAATDIFAATFHHSNGNVYFRLMKGDDSGEDDYIVSKDTLYYCTLSRAAGNDTVSLLIYSNSARTTLLDTLSVSGFGTTKWRYCYAFAAFTSGMAREWDGYVQNLDLNEPVYYDESCSVIIGVLASASRAWGYVRASAVLIGTVVSATKSWGRTIASAVVMGLTVTASRAVTLARASAVKIGTVVSATKSWVTTITSSVVVGIVTTASRVFGNVRLSAVIIGMAVSTTRAVAFARVAEVLIGVTASAIKSWIGQRLSRIRVLLVSKKSRATLLVSKKSRTSVILKGGDQNG